MRAPSTLKDNNKDDMGNILAIDTTTTALNVVLIKGDDTFSVSKELGKSGHSANLMPCIDDLLSSNGVDISDVDTVAAVVGPGSFTGIRIGVSAMTAIAFANNAKRIAVTSFELIAYNRSRVLAAVDAGHGNLYLGDCEDGKVVDARFVEANDAKNVQNAVFEPCVNVCDALAKVVKNKAKKGEYVNVIEPYYMRKSQAEREKDEI